MRARRLQKSSPRRKIHYDSNFMQFYALEFVYYFKRISLLVFSGWKAEWIKYEFWLKISIIWNLAESILEVHN